MLLIKEQRNTNKPTSSKYKILCKAIMYSIPVSRCVYYVGLFGKIVENPPANYCLILRVGIALNRLNQLNRTILDEIRTTSIITKKVLRLIKLVKFHSIVIIQSETTLLSQSLITLFSSNKIPIICAKTTSVFTSKKVRLNVVKS